MTKDAFKNIKDKLKDVCLFGKCFTGDTLVHTASGYRAIGEIEVGDLVYSMQETTGEVGLKKVEKISCTEVHTIYEIETEEKVTIKTTAYHPLYVAEKGWVNAINLVERDRLVSPDGVIEVKSIQKIRYEEPVTMYNFEVEDWVSYFVSELNIYVHNGGKHPKGNVDPDTSEIIPDLTTGKGYDAGDSPVRIDGEWSENDMKQALLGHPPRGLGSPDIHHGGQMPGAAKHEILPDNHRTNAALHPNKYNQGVTAEMRKDDRELHWWYRARE